MIKYFKNFDDYIEYIQSDYYIKRRNNGRGFYLMTDDPHNTLNNITKYEYDDEYMGFNIIAKKIYTREVIGFDSILTIGIEKTSYTYDRDIYVII